MEPGKIFEMTLSSRRRLYGILMDTSPDELSSIPEGSANNIWWNVVHSLVTQQLLMYGLSNLNPRIEEHWIEGYRKGSFPSEEPDRNKIMTIGSYLLSTIEWARDDYGNGLFKTFNSYTTSAGVTLNSIDDALLFNMYHEGLHMGTVLGIQKSIRI